MKKGYKVQFSGWTQDYGFARKFKYKRTWKWWLGRVLKIPCITMWRCSCVGKKVKVTIEVVE